jgi:multicomponent Na+:H+ antiporter subunit E
VNVRSWVVAGVAFGPLWAFVNGAHLTPTSMLTNLIVGTTVGLVVTYVFRQFYGTEIDVLRGIAVVPYAVRYALAFVREVIVANLDVAYRVLAIRMPFEPQVIYVPLRVETSLGVTTIANSITITPGTVTLDHDPDENALYVHLIDGRDPKSVVEPIREWEDYALVIFDEEHDPGDPPPKIRVHPPDYPPEPKTITEIHPREQRLMEQRAETMAEERSDDERDEQNGGEQDGR